MKAEELRRLNVDELKVRASELGESLFKLKLKLKTSQKPQSHLLGAYRLDIARIHTILREKGAPVK